MNKSLDLSSNDQKTRKSKNPSRKSVSLKGSKNKQVETSAMMVKEPAILKTEDRLKLALETMDPHFEASKRSEQESFEVNPLESQADSDDSRPNR